MIVAPIPRIIRPPIPHPLGLESGLPPDYPFLLIGAGLEGWWRFADAAHVTHSSGAISQVDDQSGNARHMTQSSALLKPDYDTSSFSRAAAAFGGGQELKNAALAAAMPTNNFSTWAVFQCDDTSTSQAILSVASTGGYGIGIESAKWTDRHKGVATLDDGAANTSFHWIGTVRISGTEHMLIDGVEVTLASSTGGVGALSGDSFLGALVTGVFPFVGWIFEAGAVSRVLTGGAPGVGNPVTGEWALLNTYVNTFY